MQNKFTSLSQFVRNVAPNKTKVCTAVPPNIPVHIPYKKQRHIQYW